MYTKKTIINWIDPTGIGFTTSQHAFIQSFMSNAINDLKTDGVNYGNSRNGIRHWDNESSAMAWINFQLQNFGPGGTIVPDAIVSWEIQDL